MPLQLKLKRGAVDSQLAYFLLLDNTGLYNVTTNPGGYGTPNPDRATLALYLYGYKYKKDVDDTPLNISNLDPTAVTQWQIPMPTDGYYYFTLLGFNIYDVLLPYAQGVYVYYAGGYYKSLDVIATGEDPINNPSLWEPVADLTSDDVSGNASVYTAFSDQVPNYRAKACYQEQVQLDAEGCCDCHDREQTKTKKYQKIFVHLNAASFDCLQQKYQQADAELMYLAEYCESIHCKHCSC
jgi:hypothetical protein